MRTLDPRRTDSQEDTGGPDDAAGGPDDADRIGSGKKGRGHWMMVACCVPMLVIAVALVAAGVVGAGFILVAVMCTAMMAMMMKGMSGSEQ